MSSSPFSKKHQARLLGKNNGKNILRRLQIDFSRADSNPVLLSFKREREEKRKSCRRRRRDVCVRSRVCAYYIFALAQRVVVVVVVYI